jgi:hypothetical protein
MMDERDFEKYVDEAKMVRHCAPVFFLPTPDCKPSEIDANGTICLLDTGKCSVLVTWYHVLWHVQNALHLSTNGKTFTHPSSLPTGG